MGKVISWLKKKRTYLNAGDSKQMLVIESNNNQWENSHHINVYYQVDGRNQSDSIGRIRWLICCSRKPDWTSKNHKLVKNKINTYL